MICIGIAFFFWLLVKLSKTYSVEKEVSFRFVLPEGKAFVQQPPSSTFARIEGRGWELMFDYFSNPSLLLRYDLNNEAITTLSTNELRSAVANRLTFNNLRITETNFGGVILMLEEKSTKRVPIVLRDSLTFATGYHLLKPLTMKPDSVTLSGPQTAVDTIAFWYSDSVTISNIKNNLTQRVALSKPSNEITLSTEAITASIEVEQFTEKSLFVPLVVRNAPDSLRYFPETVKVTFTVGLSDYNKVKASDFSPEIDLGKVKLNEGKNTIPIRMVKQPDYAITLQFTPKSAEFVIFKPTISESK